MKRFINSYSTLVVIILAGLFLRLWGLDFGLPYQFHQDEPIVVNHALAYGTGDLNPHFFAIPPLASYLLFIIYGIFFVCGKLASMWGGAEEFALSFLKDPTIFYLVGRFFIGVVPGVLSVFFTYSLAKKFISEKAALYAATIMAFAFINVINAHYIYVDMLLVLFVILAYREIFSICANPTLKHYCLAGIFIGAATGAKYNGILLVIPYILAQIETVKHRNSGEKETALLNRFVLGGLIASIVFIMTNPFILFDFKGFLASTLKQSGAFWYTGWGHHIFYSLSEGTSLPLVAFGVAGLFLFFKNNRIGKILISFPLALYIVLVFRSQHFSRYILPLVPFISIGAAYLIFDYLYGKLKGYKVPRLLICAGIALLIPTFIKAVKADILFLSRDTRITSANWIKDNLEKGTKIAYDSTSFRPTIKHPYSQLVEKKEFLGNQSEEDTKSKKLEYEIGLSNKNDKGYPVYFLFDHPETQGQFLSTLPALPYDMDILKEKGIEYVVVNGQLMDDAKSNFLNVLEDESDNIKEFSPYHDNAYAETQDKISTTCIPVMSKELFSRKTTGPSLRIYKIR